VGLAPFFDKAALAAATVLRGFDREQFAAALNEHPVALCFGENAVGTAEGRVCLELATNLIARLFPRFALVSHGDAARAHAAGLEALARAINPEIGIVPAADAAACMVVGETHCDLAVPRVHVGSDGWIVRVSAEEPLGCGTTENPFAAAAAACFGTANLFRLAFGAQLPSAHLDRGFAMSVLDLDPTAARPANPAFGGVCLGDTHLVGAGAIGNAALWVLGRAPGLEGVLHVIDGERLDLGNLQRYVLSSIADVGQWKVALAEREFSRRAGGLRVRGEPLTWGEYLATLAEPWHLERVAVALDSAADRIAVQASLPARVLNAWTQAGDLGVSRHSFVGMQACLACLYLPEARTRNDDQVVADAIGLAGQERRVRDLLYTGRPVGEDLIREIAGALGVPADPLLIFADRPLRAFYTEALCGGVVLRLQTAAARTAVTEVPMAFQSALAGVLLAASIVGDAAGLAAPAGTKAVINLLRPLGEHLTVPVAKHPSGRCLCQDPEYLDAYARRHLGNVPLGRASRVA
jgi:hypothetical protein